LAGGDSTTNERQLKLSSLHRLRILQHETAKYLYSVSYSMSIPFSPSSPTKPILDTTAPVRVSKTKNPIAVKTAAPTSTNKPSKPSHQKATIIPSTSLPYRKTAKPSKKKTSRPLYHSQLTLSPTSKTVVPSATPAETTSPLTSSITLSYSPTNYTWRLDFSKSCRTNNITEGSGTGISDSYCSSYIPLGNEAAADKVPVLVNSILIVELSLELAPVNDKNIKQINLRNGDTFSFTSIGATKGHDFPLGGIQMRLDGENKLGDDLSISWIVTFSNNCSTQVFFPGNTMGWVIFVSLLNIMKCSSAL
jgi:hypothetical protein